MFKFFKCVQHDLAFDFSVQVISPDSHDEKTIRRNSCVSAMLRDAGFRHVNFVRGAYLPRDPVQGCSLSHAMAIQAATKASRPTLLLENDAVLSDAAPADLQLEVPANADAVYLGISSGGLALNSSKVTHHWKGNFYSPCSAHNLVRIYNMLSTHAVLILSERMARNWQLCAMEAALRNVPVDTVIARTHPFFNVYAQKTPWFYQAKDLGGQEEYTNVTFDGVVIDSVADLPNQLASFTPPCLSADLAAL